MFFAYSFSRGTSVPTKLYRFRYKRDFMKWCRERGYDLEACDEAWTGPGYYYARSRTHISKHVPHLDKRRGGRIGRGSWRHLHDVFTRLYRVTRKAARERVERLVRKRGVKPKKLAEKIVYAKAIGRSRRLPREVHSIARYLWENIPRKYREGRRRKWSYIAVLALAKTIHRVSREKDIDWKQIDWIHEIDWRQGYGKAKKEVLRLLGTRKSYDRISDKEIKEMLKYYEELAKHGAEIEIELEPWEIKQMF